MREGSHKNTFRMSATDPRAKRRSSYVNPFRGVFSVYQAMVGAMSATKALSM